MHPTRPERLPDDVTCRFCAGTAGEIVLDLGLQPACEFFPPAGDPGPDPLFPLRLWSCVACGLVQLADDADLPDEPEGVEPAALAQQRRAAVADARAAGLLPTGATVAEGASPHGGSWLPELASLGLRPAEPGARADVVVDAVFGLMHARDQRGALQALVDRLAPGGTLLLGFHSLAAILRGAQWNAVRLGHHAYYSTPVVVGMLAELGLTVTGARTYPLYGGTVVLSARRDGVPAPSVVATCDDEMAAGVRDVAALRGLQSAVDRSTAALRELAAAGPVHGYSAASRAVALVHLAGLPDGALRGVADASPAKQGCRMPGTRVPVVAPAELLADGPGTVLLFVSDLLDEVRRALPEVEAGGGRWVDCGAGPAQ